MSFWGSFKTFVEKFESEFVKLFKKAPTVEQTVQAVVAVAGPALEVILGFVDPSAVPIVTPIVSAIQSKLATLSAATSQLGQIQAGSSTTATVENVLNGINTDIGDLLALAQVKNSAKVQQITAAANGITQEVDLLLTKLPSVLTANAPAPSPAAASPAPAAVKAS